MSTKTATVEDQIKAELEALRVEDEARAKRVARIVSLQLPIMERCLEVLAAQPLDAAAALLAQEVPYLTDHRANAVNNLVAHAQHTRDVLMQEVASAKAAAVATTS